VRGFRTRQAFDSDVAAVARLGSRGWEPYVRQWRLEFAMDSEPLLPVLPDGVVVRGFEPGDAVAMDVSRRLPARTSGLPVVDAFAYRCFAAV
jgi:hypothetical protein